MSVSYPTLNFGLGEELDMLRDSVRSFCDAELAPRAAEIDQNNDNDISVTELEGYINSL